MSERKRFPVAGYLLLPLLILGIALIGWGWYQGQTENPAAQPATVVAATITADSQIPAIDDLPGDGFGIVSGPATPWAVAGGPGEPTATPPPTAPPATIPAVALALSGPPGGSAFLPDDVATFYWSAPVQPGPGQRFVVYLVNGDFRLALGSLSEANLGRGYQLQAIPGQFVGQPGAYSWLVVLEDEATGAIIGQSENRALMIIGGN